VKDACLLEGNSLATVLLTTGYQAKGTVAATARPVRVCFLIDTLSRAGTETQLVALIRRLDRSRVEPFLCLLRDAPGRPHPLEPDCCPVLRLGVRSFRRLTLPLHVLRLARFLRRNRIDVLQVYFHDSTVFGVLTGWLAHVPHVVRTRNNLGYSSTPWRRRIGRACNWIVDRTIANCEACRQSLLADEGPPPESVVVLENGVDVSRFSNLPPVSARPAPPRVGMVGNLRPVKDPELLVRAAAEVLAVRPDVTFQIAGQGELRPDLEQQVRALGMEGQFLLPGAIADVPGFLGGLDVAVLCSRSEGMSNAVLEYMAAGRPIVATAVGGTVELLADGVTGLLTPPGDARGLAMAIIRLLEDRPLAASLGAAARRRAIERFSREAMVRRFEDFYVELLANR
jgi:glycosyltransferase involved in cell wall biosynthesis